MEGGGQRDRRSVVDEAGGAIKGVQREGAGDMKKEDADLFLSSAPPIRLRHGLSGVGSYEAKEKLTKVAEQEDAREQRHRRSRVVVELLEVVGGAERLVMVQVIRAIFGQRDEQRCPENEADRVIKGVALRETSPMHGLMLQLDAVGDRQGAEATRRGKRVFD